MKTLIIKNLSTLNVHIVAYLVFVYEQHLIDPDKGYDVMFHELKERYKINLTVKESKDKLKVTYTFTDAEDNVNA